MAITVYTKPACVQCTATYRALDSKGIEYEIHDLSQDPAALEQVKALGYLQAQPDASFGGLFAMHAFFTRPGLFNGVIAVSPTLTWDNRYVYRRAQEWVKKTPERPVTLVMSVGNEGAELDREFDALKSLLQKSRSLDFEAIRYPDEDHGSVVLPTHYAGLRKVFEPFRFVLGPPTEDPKKLYARARDHYAKASARAGFAMPMLCCSPDFTNPFRSKNSVVSPT